MAPLKCCVSDCKSTSNTHRLFCIPVNDNLRSLWMSFLLPTNPHLLGLNKNQLLKKRVCIRHFDKTQFDQAGVRIRHSYPCLFTKLEIAHGVPLTTQGYKVHMDHNYCLDHENYDDVQVETVILTGMQGDVSFQDHQYSLPSTSQSINSSHSKNDVSILDHQSLIPATSQAPETANMQVEDKQLGSCSNTMETTAAVVSFFDDLFDSVNGSSGGVKGKLRCAVKPNSPHQDVWRSYIRALKNMIFIDVNSKFARQAGKERHVRVPSLDGWIVTLESFLGLAKLLFSKFEVKSFYPRYINQDPLENFFGRIRAMNYRNVNPDVNTFGYAFKSLVMSNILSPHSKFANCEEDNGDMLIDLNYLFTSQKKKSDENVSPNILFKEPLSSATPSKSDIENVLAEKVRVQKSAYTAGYICRKMTKKYNCNLCIKTYTTKEILGIHKYIQNREFKRLKNNNLAYPNAQILVLYREISQIVHSYLNQHCHEINIKKILKTIIAKKNISWLGCNEHKAVILNDCITLIIRLQTHNWCNIINKILDGKLEEKYVLQMHSMQINALNKYKTHRLRKAALNK